MVYNKSGNDEYAGNISFSFFFFLLSSVGNLNTALEYC